MELFFEVLAYATAIITSLLIGLVLGARTARRKPISTGFRTYLEALGRYYEQKAGNARIAFDSDRARLREDPDDRYFMAACSNSKSTYRAYRDAGQLLQALLAVADGRPHPSQYELVEQGYMDESELPGQLRKLRQEATKAKDEKEPLEC